MSKITILGVRASGKTTLANKLGELFNIPVTHLDKIFWREKGGLADDVFVKEVQEVITNNNTWIIEGSMPNSRTLDLRIAKADIIILYDMPLYVLLWRHSKRFFKYFNKVRPDVGADNRGEPFPFRWKVIQHARLYPIEELYSKVLPYSESKTVIVLRSYKEEFSLLHQLDVILK
jgi:adenylate kinase family enzyme